MSDLLGLTDFRATMAALLVSGLGDDITVSDAIPDSITPPAVYVTWSNPWLLPTTFCEYSAALQLIVVAQRIEPGGQYGVIESMIGEILQILTRNRIALRDVNSPFPINIGGVDYLASSINLVTELGD